MLAKKIRCTITHKVWHTPTVLGIRFESNKKFKFEPGQFLSISVPHRDGKSRPLRRAYSFAQGTRASYKQGYELCVKIVDGGAGTGHLATLNIGDQFEAHAPYGDFVYRAPEDGRGVCFVCTGTGIAPFRSMILSPEFQEAPPERALCVFGVRTEQEILYIGELEKAGVPTVNAISKPTIHLTGDLASPSDTVQLYPGRVTDYLRSLPQTWPWHQTDFYICGNGEMVLEVVTILEGGHGVDTKNIYREAFSVVKKDDDKDAGSSDAAA